MQNDEDDRGATEIAQRWCAAKGVDWLLARQLGVGGTAPVFEVVTPDGPRALKIYDAEFSTGDRGVIEEKRVQQQVALKGHNCKSLVQVFEGGRFEERLYLLMSRASGSELEKRLAEVPRDNIRQILHLVTEAAIFLRDSGYCHRDIKSANVFVSDDFSEATLLDVSVVRDIHDPIGIGTDHEGQLPVVATARYSPPEYLFRLIEPGPALWHALTVYQLGAVLHDLIMRSSLFQDEYEKARTNRYRFAWLVATVDPVVDAPDVDKDLILLARRALDKSWERRSALRLEDFLDDPSVRRRHALEALGFAAEPAPEHQDVSVSLERVKKVTEGVERALLDFFKTNRLRASHQIRPAATDTSKTIHFEWKGGPRDHRQKYEFILHVAFSVRSNAVSVGMTALLISAGDTNREARIDLPDVKDDPGIVSQLTRQAEAALAELSQQLLRPDPVAPTGGRTV